MDAILREQNVFAQRTNVFMAVMMMVHAFGQRIVRQPAKTDVIIIPASVLIDHVVTAPMSNSALVFLDGVVKKMNVIDSITNPKSHICR